MKKKNLGGKNHPHSPEIKTPPTIHKFKTRTWNHNGGEIDGPLCRTPMAYVIPSITPQFILVNKIKN
jgi:hypothetical protein